MLQYKNVDVFKKNPSQFYYFCIRYIFFFLTILLSSLFFSGPITIDLISSKDNFIPKTVTSETGTWLKKISHRSTTSSLWPRTTEKP